jgi:hypothetical protein
MAHSTGRRAEGIAMALTSWHPGIAFVPEDEHSALSRHEAFAHKLFGLLYEALPALRGRFRFYRDPQTSDLWSVFDTPGHSFGLQLDPDIEVICLWNAGAAEEVGHWPPSIPDPVAFAIRRVREFYLCSDQDR